MTDTTLRFGSVCSGIEAASVAWHPLGWQAAWLSEIEPFPSAVLAHHYPDVPNLGDMTLLPERIASGEVEAPDLFCGGTPCQAFSVAGQRRSLDDARGNLSLTFCEIADAIDAARHVRGDAPAVIFWENVPGVLSTKDNAFGCFIAALAGGTEPLVPAGRWTDAGVVLGPKRAVAWRVLDAQYFGLAQRRKRVFVVASAREGFDPGAVLFESEGVRRDSAPSRESREVAPTIPACSTGGGGLGTDFDLDGGVIRQRQWPAEITSALCAADGPKGVSDQYAHEGKLIAMAHGQANAEIKQDGSCPTITCLHEAPIVAHTLRGEGFDAGEDGTGRGTPIIAFDTTQITSPANVSNPKPGDPCHPLAAGAHAPAIAFPANLSGTQCARAENLSPAMGAKNPVAVTAGMAVRRLTPRECERLQGFPDCYTLIPWRKKPADECPDGPRYKALGNSWAVPCVRWIGERIARELR